MKAALSFDCYCTCKILCNALCILSVVRVSSVSAHVSVCVCQTMQPDLLVVSDKSSIVDDKHDCIIFVCSIG